MAHLPDFLIQEALQLPAIETKLKMRCQDLLKKIPGKSKTISPGQTVQRRFESIQRLLRRRKLRKHRLQTR